MPFLFAQNSWNKLLYFNFSSYPNFLVCFNFCLWLQIHNSAFNKKCFDATNEKPNDIGDDKNAVYQIEEICGIVDGADSWEPQILPCDGSVWNQITFAATLLKMPLHAIIQDLLD